MRVVTVFGSAAALVPIVAVVGLVLLRRRHTWAPLGFLVAAYGGAAVAYHLVKRLVGRPRPPLPLRIAAASGSAFPSGHAAQSAAVYAALVAVAVTSSSPARRVVSWIAAGVAIILIGVSRLYLGVHWATDVIVGWAVGLGWVLVLVPPARTLRALSRPGRR